MTTDFKPITKAEARQFQIEGEIRGHKNNLSAFKLRQSLGETGWESTIEWTKKQLENLATENAALSN